MIDRNFIEKIESMARPETVDVDGKTYSTKGLEPVRRPTPTPITVYTLTGLVDYWDSNPDKVNLGECFIHIRDFRHAVILGGVCGPFCERDEYLAAEAPACPFLFDFWHDREKFMIALQASFAPTTARNNLLCVVGNVLQQAEINTNDDGVTQRTTTRQGIARKGETDLPNPVTLQPYTTFTEIDQPEIQYVFRMRENHGKVECALFDADGNKYKLDTALSIKEYLSEAIPEAKIIV